MDGHETQGHLSSFRPCPCRTCTKNSRLKLCNIFGRLLFVRSATPERGRAEAGKALEAARVAETEAASHRATPAQKQKQIAELEERAQLETRSSSRRRPRCSSATGFGSCRGYAEECSFNACAGPV
eukprot:scaffold75148_cov61-Phaeocystis_antarctica.AAC.1